MALYRKALTAKGGGGVDQKHRGPLKTSIEASVLIQKSSFTCWLVPLRCARDCSRPELTHDSQHCGNVRQLFLPKKLRLWGHWDLARPVERPVVIFSPLYYDLQESCTPTRYPRRRQISRVIPLLLWAGTLSMFPAAPLIQVSLKLFKIVLLYTFC